MVRENLTLLFYLEMLIFFWKIQQKNQDFEILKRTQRWMEWLKHNAHFLHLSSEGSIRRKAYNCSGIIDA
jgi:hypothetical protein